MSMLSSQADELRKVAFNIQGKIGRCLYRRKDVDKMQQVSGMLFEAADTIESLGQKVEDLEGMLGELPPDGKCAMLLVKQVDGEYIWGCEPYDFASYCLVDSEADTYTGMTLNDPFGRADFADKLTMAMELRRMADELNATLGGGKLTAEQVRGFLERHSMFDDATWLHGTSELVFDEDELQVMADELNATFGGGTCRITASATDGLCSDEPRKWFELSCGHSFMLDGLGTPVACPVCGKVVGE